MENAHSSMFKASQSLQAEIVSGYLHLLLEETKGFQQYPTLMFRDSFPTMVPRGALLATDPLK